MDHQPDQLYHGKPMSWWRAQTATGRPLSTVGSPMSTVYSAVAPTPATFSTEEQDHMTSPSSFAEDDHTDSRSVDDAKTNQPYAEYTHGNSPYARHAHVDTRFSKDVHVDPVLVEDVKPTQVYAKNTHVNISFSKNIHANPSFAEAVPTHLPPSPVQQEAEVPQYYNPDKGFEDYQRDTAAFPALTDYLYGNDTRTDAPENAWTEAYKAQAEHEFRCSPPKSENYEQRTIPSHRNWTPPEELYHRLQHVQHLKELTRLQGLAHPLLSRPSAPAYQELYASTPAQNPNAPGPVRNPLQMDPSRGPKSSSSKFLRDFRASTLEVQDDPGKYNDSSGPSDLTDSTEATEAGPTLRGGYEYHPYNHYASSFQNEQLSMNTNLPQYGTALAADPRFQVSGLRFRTSTAASTAASTVLHNALFNTPVANPPSVEHNHQSIYSQDDLAHHQPVQAAADADSQPPSAPEQDFRMQDYITPKQLQLLAWMTDYIKKRLTPRLEEAWAILANPLAPEKQQAGAHNYLSQLTLRIKHEHRYHQVRQQIPRIFAALQLRRQSNGDGKTFVKVGMFLQKLSAMFAPRELEYIRQCLDTMVQAESQGINPLVALHGIGPPKREQCQ
ncbi:hypothetical protein BCR34DRAFT_603579 [Clohesyomyces aquaticus]|uniref:Uncharacterized protein n=1 Tax=Clohesyomyces aquaticus TaxID=1231657 RepID=A0A1Y1ZDL1_9PLEO|nr:hypothetical protein BCR34DRAFT_603579 [Clohesyomyces aquaticus]